MVTAIKLQLSNPKNLSLPFNSSNPFTSPSTRINLRSLPFTSFSLRTTDASQPSLTASIGSPPLVSLSQWNLNSRHILVLNAVACSVAISASWLFFSAIPTLLAFKKAAESLEKLFDVTREELPDTMAAVRLSGMEISDLTMELSDLGQEITQGVRSSTRAVRLAEDRLRRLTTMAPQALMQDRTTPKTETGGPVLATSARSLREGIVKGRAILQLLFSLTGFSKWAMSYLATRGQKA